MKTTIITLSIIAAVALLLWFVAATVDTSTDVAEQENGRLIPNLTLADYNGHAVALHSLIGTPLIINSWAAWCPFCIKELPDFATIQAEFGNRVKVVGINRAESLSTAEEYTDRLGIADKLIYLLDPNDLFYKSIGGFSMPETIFVDERGVITEHKRGVMPLEEIREKTAALLGAIQ